MLQIPVPFVTSPVNFLRTGRLCADIHRISPCHGAISTSAQGIGGWIPVITGLAWAEILPTYGNGGIGLVGIGVDTPTTPGSAREVPTAGTVGAEVGLAKLRAVFRHITGSFLTETRAFMSRV